MNTGTKLIRAIMQIIVIAPLLLTSCGEVKAGSSAAACTSTTTAQIEVFDGAVERMCGCAESANTTFGQSGLVCTIPRGTTLVFLFPSIQNQHQVGIQGMSWSGANRSSAGGLNQADSVVMGSSGTFTFNDGYANLSGTIIVQ